MKPTEINGAGDYKFDTRNTLLSAIKFEDSSDSDSVDSEYKLFTEDSAFTPALSNEDSLNNASDQELDDIKYIKTEESLIYKGDGFVVKEETEINELLIKDELDISPTVLQPRTISLSQPSTEARAPGTSVDVDATPAPSDACEEKNVSATKEESIPVRKESAEELAKHRYNLLNILQLSNATTLRSKTGKGFNCAFCSKVFPEPADLKIHNVKEHKDVKPKSIMNKNILYGNYVKLDITSLECSLCGLALDNLPNLAEHLKVKHEKRLYTDIKDRILPFKFDSVDVTRCVVCSAEFVSFNMLQRHMNAHYRNHLCEVCDAGFVTKQQLWHHMKYTHQLGEFRCNFCEKVFGTKSKRNDHEKSVHFGFKRHKCAYCSERFVCYKKRNKHVIEVHNKSPIVYKCHACDRVFDMRNKLSQHTKKDHLMERKHECDLCEMKFFTKRELEKHMVKHSGEKNFTCQVCSKTYARKNTLREHMRIHANDRRFKCDKCSHAFVHKCAWRSHMKAKHGVTV